MAEATTQTDITPTKDIALYCNYPGITYEKLAVVRKVACIGLSFYETCFFLDHCASIGLNPFNKEVWAWKDNKGKINTMVGIHGYKANAAKHEDYIQVYQGEVYENDHFKIDRVNGIVEHTHGHKDRGALVGAWALCEKKNVKPIVDFAPLNEYIRTTQNKNGAWDNNPTKMILKVATGSALSLAFPVIGALPEWELETKNGITDYRNHNEPKEETEEEILQDQLQSKIAEALEEWESYEAPDKEKIGTDIRFFIDNKTITVELLQDYIDHMKEKK